MLLSRYAIVRGIAAVVMAVLFYACVFVHEDLTGCPPDDAGLLLVSDWALAPEANPESMVYSFFPAEGGDVWNFRFPGRNGGNIDLAYGAYRIIAYNDDTSRILYRDISEYATFTFYCRKGGLFDGLGGTIDAPLGPEESPDGEAVEICPDMLWGSTLSSFAFDAASPREIKLFPAPIIARYSYTIERIENLDGVARMCCAISGMASFLRPSDMYRGKESVTLPLKAARAKEDTVDGKFLTFGVPAGSASPNILTLYVWLTDGRRFSYSFDVSDQVRNAPDAMDVELIVGGIVLPESEQSAIGGDLDVSVDGWTTVIVDINA